MCVIPVSALEEGYRGIGKGNRRDKRISFLKRKDWKVRIVHRGDCWGMTKTYTMKAVNKVRVIHPVLRH